MRYRTILITGYAAVVTVMLGVVGSAINQQRQLTLQQNRDVDAAINQIVAKHQERKRLAALGLAPPATQVAYSHRRAPSAETTGSAVGEAAAADSLPPTEAKPLAVLQSTKKAGRRAGRKHDHFLPTALATLPKLTTYTLLGLR
jgi:hypothetical protein